MNPLPINAGATFPSNLAVPHLRDELSKTHAAFWIDGHECINAGKQRALPPGCAASPMLHLHFNLFISDPCVYPTSLLLLRAHLSAQEKDQALISEETQNPSPQLI